MELLASGGANERYEWVPVLAIVIFMIALSYVPAIAYRNLTQSLAYHPDTFSDKLSTSETYGPPTATMPESRNANIAGMLTPS